MNHVADSRALQVRLMIDARRHVVVSTPAVLARCVRGVGAPCAFSFTLTSRFEIRRPRRPPLHERNSTGFAARGGGGPRCAPPHAAPAIRIRSWQAVMLRPWPWVALIGTAVLVVDGVKPGHHELWGRPTPAEPQASRAGPKIPIRHFVTLLMENRAADHVFGCFGLPGFDGIPPGGRVLGHIANNACA